MCYFITISLNALILSKVSSGMSLVIYLQSRSQGVTTPMTTTVNIYFVTSWVILKGFYMHSVCVIPDTFDPFYTE